MNILFTKNRYVGKWKKDKYVSEKKNEYVSEKKNKYVSEKKYKYVSEKSIGLYLSKIPTLIPT